MEVRAEGMRLPERVGIEEGIVVVVVVLAFVMVRRAVIGVGVAEEEKVTL